MYCDRCGTAVDPSIEYCPACGARQVMTPLPPAADTALPPRPNPLAPVATGPGDWMGMGFNAVTANFWVFVLLAAIYLLASSAAPVILQGPIAMGLYWAALRQILGRPASPNDLGTGFNLFGQGLLICLLLTVIFTVAGFLLLVPFFLAAALLQFPYLLVLDRKLDAWPALQESFRVSQFHLGKLFLLTLLQVVLLVAGTLLCGVGLLVAVPVVFASSAAAYVDLYGIRPETRDSV